MARLRSVEDVLLAPIDPEQATKLVELSRLVASWGERMNLTGHRGPEAIFDQLVVDALALREQIRKLVAASPGQRLVDLGSGAGFPGLPIAIMEPDTTVTLVDSRERRHHFQRAARRELGLSNVEPRLGRIEDLEATPCDVTVAQALARAEQAVELGLVWTRPGGLIVIPGASAPPRIQTRPDVSSCGTCTYETPSGRSRSLWWGKKAGSVSPAT